MDGLEISQELQTEEAVAELSFAAAPIDVERPGFGSLLPALRLAREGAIDLEVVFRYQAALAEHLAESRARLDAMEVPEELRTALEGAMVATRGMLERMEFVLVRVGIFLENGNPDDLDAAIRVLEGIHGEMEQVLRQAV